MLRQHTLLFFLSIIVTGTVVLVTNISYGKPIVVPLPTVENAEFSPTVVYMENPAYAKIEEQDLRQVLDSTKNLVKSHFDLTLHPPASITVVTISKAFSRIKNVAPSYTDLIGNFRNGVIDWRRVQNGVAENIRESARPVSELIEFARPNLLYFPAGETAESLAKAVTETLKIRFTRWINATSAEEPLDAEEQLYNEYLYWVLLASKGINADIILTNNHSRPRKIYLAVILSETKKSRLAEKEANDYHSLFYNY